MKYDYRQSFKDWNYNDACLIKIVFKHIQELIKIQKVALFHLNNH